MCCTFTSTSVFPLRSVLVVTVPAAAGAMPVLVSLSSLDQAAVEIRKVMAMNNAILVCRMCVSPCSGRVSRALMSSSDVGFSHLRCRRSGAAFVFLPPRMPGAPSPPVVVLRSVQAEAFAFPISSIVLTAFSTPRYPFWVHLRHNLAYSRLHRLPRSPRLNIRRGPSD